MRRPKRFETGAAVFVLVMLVILAIDIGPAVQSYLAVTDAAREVGRRSAVAGQSVDSASAIGLIDQRLAENGLDPTNATKAVSIRPNGWPGASDDTVLVTAEYPHRFAILSGLVGWTGADATINLRSSLPFRHE